MKSAIKLFIVFLSFVVFFGATADTYAVTRRVLPGRTVTRSTTSGSVGVSVRLRRDRHALIINFSRLNLASGVNFALTYIANGKLEGTQGALHPAGEIATSRELLFGTCSTSVCTYHKNITNARLEVRIQMKNGKTIIRRFRIKV